MKQRMNDYHIRMQAIDSRGEDKIVRGPAEQGVPVPHESVRDHPKDELRYMGAGNKGHSVPNNGTGICCARCLRIAQWKVFDPLRIDMDLAAIVVSEPLN